MVGRERLRWRMLFQAREQILVQEHQRRLFRLLRTLTTIGRCVVYVLAATEQIVGPEPRGATFASGVIRLTCSAAPWPGRLNRYAASLCEQDLIDQSMATKFASFARRYSVARKFKRRPHSCQRLVTSVLSAAVNAAARPSILRSPNPNNANQSRTVSACLLMAN